MKSKKSATPKPAPKQYDYVVESEFQVVTNDGKPHVIKARSNAEAEEILRADLPECMRGNWDIRRMGDEPRIAAIDDYAKFRSEISVIDHQISELQSERANLLDKIENARRRAYDLPTDDLFFEIFDKPDANC